MTADFKYIWEGIYASFTDAPMDDGVFNSEDWLSKQVSRVEKIRKDEAVFHKAREYALTPILATMAGATRQVKVLDFGGGLGTNFLSATGNITHKNNINFTIIEKKEICKCGNELFSGLDKVSFYESLDETVKSFDLVHAGSSIQYVDNWKNLLTVFADYCPQYIVLSEVLAGDNPSFVTIQKYYGKNILVRFLNMTELISHMIDLQYELILCQNYISDSNGAGNPLPMGNFPPEYQVDYSRNMVFKLL